MNSSSTSRRRPGRPRGDQSGSGREALLEAARELLCEKGLPRLTSREVAQRAGVKPALINYYFGDRRGLLQAVMEEASGDLGSRLQRAATSHGSVEERLTRLLESTLKAFAEEPYAPRLLFEQVIFADDDLMDRFVERSGRAQFDAFRRVIEDGQREGCFRAVDTEIALGALGGLCILFGAATPLLQRLMDLDELTPESAKSIAQRASELIVHGLAASREGGA
jgi:TetR/AcrR family transcriptional regulator